LDNGINYKDKNIQISRRSFFKKSAIVAGGSIITAEDLFAGVGAERKVLKLHNVHLNKTFYAPFFEKNYYKLSGLFEVNKALVDFRAKEITRIDVKLINLLYDIKQHIGHDVEFNVLSGYRTKRTNDMLRRKSEGVAKNSYHIKGMAVDINVPNVSLRKLRDIALGLKKGGVGYYPSHNFIHVDVGPVRSWRRG